MVSDARALLAVGRQNAADRVSRMVERIERQRQQQVNRDAEIRARKER